MSCVGSQRVELVANVQTRVLLVPAGSMELLNRRVRKAWCLKATHADTAESVLGLRTLVTHQVRVVARSGFSRRAVLVGERRSAKFLRTNPAQGSGVHFYGIDSYQPAFYRAQLLCEVT